MQLYSLPLLHFQYRVSPLSRVIKNIYIQKCVPLYFVMFEIYIFEDINATNHRLDFKI